MVPLNKTVWGINRREWDPDDPTKLTYRLSQSPFRDITITSHVHPFPVVYNALTKILESPDAETVELLVEENWGPMAPWKDLWGFWLNAKLPGERIVSEAQSPTRISSTANVDQHEDIRMRLRVRNAAKTYKDASQNTKAKEKGKRSGKPKAKTTRTQRLVRTSSSWIRPMGR